MPAKFSNFWQSKLKTIASVAVIVFNLTCVMPVPGITFQTSYILAIFHSFILRMLLLRHSAATWLLSEAEADRHRICLEDITLWCDCTQPRTFDKKCHYRNHPK